MNNHHDNTAGWAFMLALLAIPVTVFVSIWIVNKFVKSDTVLTEEDEWYARNG